MATLAQRRHRRVPALSELNLRIVLEQGDLERSCPHELNHEEELAIEREAYDVYWDHPHLHESILKRLPSYKSSALGREVLGYLFVNLQHPHSLPIAFECRLNRRKLRKEAFDYANKLQGFDEWALISAHVHIVTGIARDLTETEDLANRRIFKIHAEGLRQLSRHTRPFEHEAPDTTMALFGELPFNTSMTFVEDNMAGISALPFHTQLIDEADNLTASSQLPFLMTDIQQFNSDLVQVAHSFALLAELPFHTRAIPRPSQTLAKRARTRAVLTELPFHNAQPSEDPPGIPTPVDWTTQVLKAEAPEDEHQESHNRSPGLLPNLNRTPASAAADPTRLSPPDPTCPVCAADYTPHEDPHQPLKLLCGHILCAECADRWLKDRNECMFCRRMLYFRQPSRAIGMKLVAMGGEVLCRTATRWWDWGDEEGVLRN